MRCLKILIGIACFCFALPALAQPYVDLLKVNYLYGFRSGSQPGTPYQHLLVNADVPLKIKTGSYLVFSPFYENWSLDSATRTDAIPQVSSIGLPIVIQFPIQKNKWSLMLAVIPRFNSEGLKISDSSFQIGAATTIMYQFNEKLKCRIGVYVNREFFGIYVVPLAGLDWKLSERDNLFGILPGRLCYEHKLNTHFYMGGLYVSTTNSYLLQPGTYLRIGDNRISAYLDYYATKHLVASAHLGYGILRKLGSGWVGHRDYVRGFDWSDGPFAQFTVAYRMRL